MVTQIQPLPKDNQCDMTNWCRITILGIFCSFQFLKLSNYLFMLYSTLFEYTNLNFKSNELIIVFIALLYIEVCQPSVNFIEYVVIGLTNFTNSYNGQPYCPFHSNYGYCNAAYTCFDVLMPTTISKALSIPVYLRA